MGKTMMLKSSRTLPLVKLFQDTDENQKVVLRDDDVHRGFMMRCKHTRASAVSFQDDLHDYDPDHDNYDDDQTIG